MVPEEACRHVTQGCCRVPSLCEHSESGNQDVARHMHRRESLLHRHMSRSATIAAIVYSVALEQERSK